MRQAAEFSGLDLDWIIRTRRALGIAIGDPDDVTLTDATSRRFKLNRTMRESGLPETRQISIYRALGAAMARYTDALRRSSTEALLVHGGTEYDISQRFRTWMDIAMPAFGPSLRVHRAHPSARAHAPGHPTFEESAGRAAEDHCPDRGGVRRRGRLHPARARSCRRRSSARSRSARRRRMAVAKPPVRLVKSIGDALMLVCPEPEPLVVAALTLVDDSPDLPEMRGGVAFGPALARDGDCYGSTVNLAARLCDRARPGRAHDRLGRPTRSATATASPAGRSA